MAPRSLFRKPSESSSNEDVSSDHRADTSASAADDNLLSGINTLDSASSAGPSGQAGLPTSLPALANSATRDKLRDVLMHSLLEERALRDAANRLGKDPSDPEVQQMAKTAYQGVAHQLSDVVDYKYAGDEMQNARAAANDGVNRATHAQLDRVWRGADAVGITAAPGVYQALVPRHSNVNGDEVQTITANLDLALGLRAPIPTYLHGLHGLHTDRYARDYAEIEMVGKGGYGKVYKVKHKLDDSFYAVKRIMVSPSKIQAMTKQGAQAQEMENMLKEVRSLARLEHVNIVRYHNAWLEYSPAGNILHPGQLIDDASTVTSTTSAYGISYGQPREHSDMGIVFENDSDTGARAEESHGEAEEMSLNTMATKRKDRRTSEATVTSLSTSKSHRSAGDGNGFMIEEDEEDVEMIPRSHSPTLEESSSFMSNSDMPNKLVATRHTGTCLTLNIQMSLYDSNLSAFLSSEKPGPTHCYHSCLSLELLDSILSGVEYLHSKGVVHRDLKPANVFLSLSTDRRQPLNSVDLSSCHDCSGRDCLYVTPRIGDFGLVAALGDNATSRPVGTEFYRPPAGGSVNEKLDVYALGVVAFEMTQCFGTRMERIEALTNLRRGEFPEGFGEAIGGDMGVKVEALLAGMLCADQDLRWGCDHVVKEIETILSGYKA